MSLEKEPTQSNESMHSDDASAREYSKSTIRRNKITTGIQTQAGLELFTYMNQNYGSAVWSKVLTGILAIEAELK
jgi:hypothetical protein